MAEKMGNSTKRARDVAGQDAALIRQEQAIKMRCARMPYSRIARELGYSDKSGAYRAVQAGLQRHYRETATDRQQLLEQILMDQALMQAAIWPRVMAGDIDAFRAMVRLQERQARMLGIDAPTKIELTDEMDREIKLLAQQLGSDPSWDVTAIEGLAPEGVTSGGTSGGDPD